MPFDATDPRLTAFALGEIVEDADRAEVESVLAESAEARQFVEEIRATARILSERLRDEPSPGLATEHRLAIEDALGTEDPSLPLPWIRRRWPLAAAASLLVAGTAAWLIWDRGTKPHAAPLATAQHFRDGLALHDEAAPAPAAASPPRGGQASRGEATRPGGPLTAGARTPGSAQDGPREPTGEGPRRGPLPAGPPERG